MRQQNGAASVPCKIKKPVKNRGAPGGAAASFLPGSRHAPPSCLPCAKNFRKRRRLPLLPLLRVMLPHKVKPSFDFLLSFRRVLKMVFDFSFSSAAILKNVFDFPLRCQLQRARLLCASCLCCCCPWFVCKSASVCAFACRLLHSYRRRHI